MYCSRVRFVFVGGVVVVVVVVVQMQCHSTLCHSMSMPMHRGDWRCAYVENAFSLRASVRATMPMHDTIYTLYWLFNSVLLSLRYVCV